MSESGFHLQSSAPAADTEDTAAAGEARLAIIGTGLMGTSIGLALRARTGAYRIAGWDPRAESLHAAYERQAIHRSASSLADAVSDADLVLIAAPVDHVSAIAQELARSAPPGVTVTDMAGTKRRIVQECESTLGSRFVGGHPMAGSELAGPGCARADVVTDAPWIITPTARTDQGAIAAVETLIRNAGSCPIRMTPLEHDRMAASLSHLPHVVAYALMGSIGRPLDPGTLRLAAGSFRSATRVAASDPEHWTAIMSDNADAILDAIDRLQSRLNSIRSALADADAERLRALLADGHRT